MTQVACRALLGGVALVSALLASAGPTTFATHGQAIRAGVVITNANQRANFAANDLPFVWYNLDQNALVKPAGWNIYNPHSPGQLTQYQYNRWLAIGGVAPSPVGTLLTKAMAPYWEVSLDTTTDTAINDYDVLFLPVYGTFSLNAAERSRLHRFIDQGGVLWIEVNAGTKIDAANSAPVSFLTNAFGSGPSIFDPTTTVASTPFTISSLPEANFTTTLARADLGAAGFGNLIPSINGLFEEFDRFTPIAVDGTNPALPTVLAAKVGNGTLVVTCRGQASYLNQASVNGSYNPNVTFQALPTTPDANANQVARFGVNVINLASSFTQSSQGSRKLSGSPIDVGAPLLADWKDKTAGIGNYSAAPITYKGLVIVSTQDHVFAYSAKPGSDLDSDGNPDDGLQDFGLGKTRDLIWQSPPLNGPISGAAAMEVPNNPNGPSDIVTVVDGSGNLVVFNAFPLNPAGSFPTAPGAVNPILRSYGPPNGAPQAPGGVAPGLPVPYSPTICDGLIYVTDNVDNSFGTPTGRVWVVDPRATDPTKVYVNSWAVGGPPNAVLQAASNSATIGEIPIQDNSGGVDKVLYLPTAPTTGIGGVTAGIQSIWIGVKGENHALSLNQTNQLEITTRASANGRPIYVPNNGGSLTSSAYGVRLTLISQQTDAAGVTYTVPLTATQMNTLITGTYTNTSGVLDFDLKSGVTIGNFNAFNIVGVTVDYYFDWNSGSTDVRNVVRGAINFPDDANHQKYVIGNLGLSPAGTIYAVVGNEGDTQGDGSFYALREQGQGSFNVVSRFDLYDSFSLLTPSSTTPQSATPVSETLEDNDGVQNIPGAQAFLSGRFSDLTFSGGPAVADGRVFVKARGLKQSSFGFKVPQTLLLCFAAEPQPATFTVPVLDPNFTILQPDYSRSTDKTQPEVFAQVAGSQVTYNAGVDHGTVSIANLATSQRGQLSQVLNESLPVIIRQAGKPDFSLDPSTVGSWSPLQWYTVFHGIDPGKFQGAASYMNTGSPIVTGSNVFIACNSYLPYIFQGQSPLGKTPTGTLAAFNAALSPTNNTFDVPNEFYQTGPGVWKPILSGDTFNFRPYFHQITQLYNGVLDLNGLGGAAFRSTPDLVWPQTSSAGSFTEYRQKVYQTVLDGADISNPPLCYGIVAGDGGLYAYSNLGVYGFKRADFTVADQGRLASFDPAGNALWSTDQSVSYGIGTAVASTTGAPANSHPLVRPTRAYPIGPDYLVVDPGSNRLARIDKSGREVRSIEAFLVDPIFQPEGYKAGEPVTFNAPQDVLTFTDFQSNSPFSNAQPLEYWRHYVVADTGNHRLVELVDRYAVNVTTHKPTNPIALGVLYYHSPSSLSGKNYDYNSVARIQLATLSATGNPQYVYAASMGTSAPSRVGLGLDTPVQDQVPSSTTNPFQDRESRAGNGGILIINGAQTQVITQVVIPQIGAGVLYSPTTGTFNTQPIPAQYKKLNNLSSVSLNYNWPDNAGSQPTLNIMFTDSTGVYEVNIQNNPIKVNGSTQDWVVDWMLPAAVYTQLRRDPGTNLPNQALFLNAQELKAAYARRTSAGTILLTNGYYGVDQDPAQTPFAGEVIELEGDILNPNLTRGFSFNAPFFGFDSLSVRYQLPTIKGARGIVAPVFADRR